MPYGQTSKFEQNISLTEALRLCLPINLPVMVTFDRNIPVSQEEIRSRAACLRVGDQPLQVVFEMDPVRVQAQALGEPTGPVVYVCRFDGNVCEAIVNRCALSVNLRGGIGNVISALEASTRAIELDAEALKAIAAQTRTMRDNLPRPVAESIVAVVCSTRPDRAEYNEVFSGDYAALGAHISSPLSPRALLHIADLASALAVRNGHKGIGQGDVATVLQQAAQHRLVHGRRGSIPGEVQDLRDRIVSRLLQARLEKVA